MKKNLFWALALVVFAGLASCNSEPGTDDSAVTSIALNTTSLTLSIGDIQRLTPVVEPTGATATYLWTSSDTTVATVSSNGSVTAVAAGSAVVTVAVEGTDLSATCQVEVKSYLENIQFTTAIVWDRDTTAYGDTLYTIEASDGTSYNVKIVEAELWLFSEGFYVNNSGYLDGTAQAAIIEIHAPMYYAPGWANGSDRGTQFCLGTWAVLDAPQYTKETTPCVFDQDAYFTAMETLLSADDVTADMFVAAAATFDGPIMTEYEYITDESGEGGYSSYYIPAAYVNAAEVNCESHTSLNYMMSLTYSSADVTMLGAYYGLKLDETGENFVYPFEMDTKTFHYEQGTKTSSVSKLTPSHIPAIKQDMPEMATRLEQQLKANNIKVLKVK